MKKAIILLLCCVVLVSMAGCGGNTAPPTESTPTTVSETAINETPPVTMVEPTEKEKEPTPTECKEQATEPTVTEKQVGRMKENFSENLSMLRNTAEDKLERHTNKMFWISLIASGVLIVLELMRHILSAISVI